MGPADPLLLGVEIGGTKLQLGLGRGDGRLVRLVRRTIRPEDGARGILRQIADALPGLLGGEPAGGPRPSAIGIGFGGPVDADRGTVVRSHQVEGWEGFDLAGWSRDELGIPLAAVANDADTAGLGEVRFGAGLGLSPVFYVTIGSGIGGGLILDGRIYRGAGGGAAEIGHLWVDDGALGPRRLEDLASGWSIGSAARILLDLDPRAGPLLELARGTPDPVDVRIVATAARQGDPRACSVLARAARAVGQALGHVVTLLGPRRIILGGGVSLVDDAFWLDPIRASTRERAFPPFQDHHDILTAALGEEVVIHGALALARDLIQTH
jgi:glucokinase